MGRGSIDHVAFAVKDDAALQNLYKRAQEQDWQILNDYHQVREYKDF